MASAGMGDVLTGMIAGLIAQGMRPDTAARTAVYLHGAAADTLSRTLAPYGYLAGEVAQALPGEIARLLRED
jgi:NAD(P)H-hydrate epimerase